MIFIGLKRLAWPASLVATTSVMLHYDQKMTGDNTDPKRKGKRDTAGGMGRDVLKLRSFKPNARGWLAFLLHSTCGDLSLSL